MRPERFGRYQTSWRHGPIPRGKRAVTIGSPGPTSAKDIRKTRCALPGWRWKTGIRRPPSAKLICSHKAVMHVWRDGIPGSLRTGSVRDELSGGGWFMPSDVAEKHQRDNGDELRHDGERHQRDR